MGEEEGKDGKLAFGQRLQLFHIGPWRGHYLRYDTFKSLIKTLAEHLESGSLALKALDAQPEEQTFRRLLQEDVTMANEFVTSHTATLSSNLDSFEEKLQAMQSRTGAAGGGDSGMEGAAAPRRSPNQSLRNRKRRAKGRGKGSGEDGSVLEGNSSSLAEDGTFSLRHLHDLQQLCIDFVQLREYVNLNRKGFIRILEKHAHHLHQDNSEDIERICLERFCDSSIMKGLAARIEHLRDGVQQWAPSQIVHTELFEQMMSIKVLSQLQDHPSADRSASDSFWNFMPVASVLFQKGFHSFIKVLCISLVSGFGWKTQEGDGSFDVGRFASIGILFTLMTLARNQSMLWARSFRGSMTSTGSIAVLARGAVLVSLLLLPTSGVGWRVSFLLLVLENFFGVIVQSLAHRILKERSKLWTCNKSTPPVSDRTFSLLSSAFSLGGTLGALVLSLLHANAQLLGYLVTGAALIEFVLFLLSKEPTVKYPESGMDSSKYSQSSYILNPVTVLLQEQGARWVLIALVASCVGPNTLYSCAILMVGVRLGESLGLTVGRNSLRGKLNMFQISLLGTGASLSLSIVPLLLLPGEYLGVASPLTSLVERPSVRLYGSCILLGVFSLLNLTARICSTARRAALGGSTTGESGASLFRAASMEDMNTRVWLFKLSKSFGPFVVGVTIENRHTSLLYVASLLFFWGAITAVAGLLQLRKKAEPYAAEREMRDMGFERWGRFIVVEGLDGSGKSTQLKKVEEKLRSAGFDVVLTGWNSSSMMGESIKNAKRMRRMRRRTFALSQSADLSEQLYDLILPALSDGKIVLADRYFYTSLARDSVRGSERDWLENLFLSMIRPDLVLYFRINVETAINRVLARRVLDEQLMSDAEEDSDGELATLTEAVLPSQSSSSWNPVDLNKQIDVSLKGGSNLVLSDAGTSLVTRMSSSTSLFVEEGEYVPKFHDPKENTLEQPKLNYYEAGLDVHLDPDPLQNFIRFQTLVSEQYDSMVEEFGFQVIDASAPIEIQHSEVMGHIDRVLRLGPPLKTNVQNILCKDPRLDSVQVRNNYLKNRTWQGLHFFFRNQHQKLLERFEQLADVASMPVVFLHANPHVDNFSKSHQGCSLADFDRSKFGPYAWDLLRLMLSVSLRQKDMTSHVLHSSVVRKARDGYLWGFAHPDMPWRQMQKMELIKVSEDEIDMNAYLAANRGWAREMRSNPLPVDHPDVLSLVQQFVESRKETELLDQYEIEEAGRGFGSMGERLRFLVVLCPKDRKGDRIFLDMKETRQDPDTQFFRNPFDHQGKRLIAASKLYCPGWMLRQGYGKLGDLEFHMRQIPPLNAKLKGLLSLADQKDFVYAAASQLGRGHRLSLQGFVSPDKLVSHLTSYLPELMEIAQRLKWEITTAFFQYKTAWEEAENLL